MRRDGNALWYEIAAPTELLRYIVAKGSVALDGVSLTVARVSGEGFAVSVILQTAAATTLAERQPGDTVNVECDILAKYVEKLLAPAAGRGLTLEFLRENGF